jgi:hypothetical protein
MSTAIVLAAALAALGQVDELGLDTVLGAPERMLARLRRIDSVEIHVSRHRVSPPVYRLWASFPVGVPAGKAIPVGLDFAAYSGVFKHIHCSEHITTPARKVSPHGTWLMEARAAMLRTWAIGDIDTLVRIDSALVLEASQNEDDSLEAMHEPPSDGLLTYRLSGIRLVAAVMPTGERSCRVAVGGEAEFNVPVPLWLYRMVVEVVLPRVLRDFTRAAGKR